MRTAGSMRARTSYSCCSKSREGRQTSLPTIYSIIQLRPINVHGIYGRQCGAYMPSRNARPRSRRMVSHDISRFRRGTRQRAAGCGPACGSRRRPQCRSRAGWTVPGELDSSSRSMVTTAFERASASTTNERRIRSARSTVPGWMRTWRNVWWPGEAAVVVEPANLVFQHRVRVATAGVFGV